MRSISKLKDEARRYEQREEWDRAIQVYLQVLQSDEASESDIEPLYNRIGDLSVRLGRPHDAIRYYEMAADRYAETGLYNNAIALCNKALRYDARNLSVLRKLGQYSAAQGFTTDARRYFLEYAEHQFRAGHTDDALAALEDFANLSDDAEICELLGRKLQAHGRSRDAANALRRAWQMRLAAGEQAEAAALRNEILGIDPQAFSETVEAPAGPASPQPAAPVRDDALPLIHPFGSDPRDNVPVDRPAAAPERSDPVPGDLAFLDDDPFDYGPMPAAAPGAGAEDGEESAPLPLIEPEAGTEDASEQDPAPLPLLEPEANADFGDQRESASQVPIDADDDAIEYEPYEESPPVAEPREDSASVADPVEGLETSSFDFSAVSDLGVDDVGLDIEHDDPFELPTLDDPPEAEETAAADPPAPPAAGGGKTGSSEDASIDDLVAASLDLPPLEGDTADGEERHGTADPGDGDPLPVFDLPPLPPLPGGDLKYTDDALLDVGPIFEIETTGETEGDDVVPGKPPLPGRAVPGGAESESGPPDADIRDWFRELTAPGERHVADADASPPDPAPTRRADLDAIDFDFMTLVPESDRFQAEAESALDAESDEALPELPGPGGDAEPDEAAAEADAPDPPRADDPDGLRIGPGEVAEPVRGGPAVPSAPTHPPSAAVPPDPPPAPRPHDSGAPFLSAMPPAVRDTVPAPGRHVPPLSAEPPLPAVKTGPLGPDADGSQAPAPLPSVPATGHRKPPAAPPLPEATAAPPPVSRATVPGSPAPESSTSGAKLSSTSAGMTPPAPPECQGEPGPETLTTASPPGSRPPDAPAPPDTKPQEDGARASKEETPREESREETGDYVDLGRMLNDQDTHTTRFRVQETTPTGDEDRDFAELLNQFKAKVSEHLPPEEAAAHYDLGIAFKEMGLIDEAIGEFQIALRTGHMRLKVYEELGHCFLHKGQYTIAVKVLQRALEMSYEDELELLGVYYHLGRAFEAMGRTDDARDAYERVLGMDFGFQDAADRLARL